MAARTVEDRIFAALVSALSGINGTAQASSTVATTASAGATSLILADASGFKDEADGYPQRKRVIIIGQDTAREEVNVVTAANATTLTLLVGLTYEHTDTQADAVKQYWYNHTVDHVRTWSEIQNGPEAPFPVVGLMALREDPTDEFYAGEIEEVTRHYRSLLADAVAISDPYDQTNDRKYQRLLADHEKALLDDVTLGGLAIDLTIEGREPFDENAVDGGTEIPLVGSLIEFEVRYRHLRGNLYW